MALEVHHMVPAGRETCMLIDETMAPLGRPSIGLGMLIQYSLGLRPGELVRLIMEDVAESTSRDMKGLFIIRLGRDHRAKAGREQYALLQISIRKSPFFCSSASHGRHVFSDYSHRP